MRIRKNRKNPDPGVLTRLATVATQKRTTPNKLAGFWTPVSKRPPFRPLVVK